MHCQTMSDKWQGDKTMAVELDDLQCCTATATAPTVAVGFGGLTSHRACKPRPNESLLIIHHLHFTTVVVEANLVKSPIPLEVEISRG